jgi:hypothetical protein
MPTYSDEDGLTDAAGASGASDDDAPTPYGGDTEEIPPVRPPGYPAEPPYATGVYNADPYAGDPYSAEAYNSTDILPAPSGGGRRARREAAAAAAAAGAVPFDQQAPNDQPTAYDQVEADQPQAPLDEVADARFDPDPVPDMGVAATGLAAAGLAAAEQVEYDEAARAAAPDVNDTYDQGAYDQGTQGHVSYEQGSYAQGALDAPGDGDASAGSGGDEPPTGRRDWTPTPLGRAVLPIALALVSVVALWAAWSHLSSDDQNAASPGPSATAPVGVPGGSTSPSPTTAASTSPSSSTSTSPSATTSTSPSGSPSAAPSGSPSASATAPVTPTVDRSVPVVVLNATGRPGLAAKVAANLRAKGWKVTSVGNWTRGGITATTIFLNGHVDAARTITGDFPQATGSIQLPKPGMPPLRMVIVVGKDYPR